LVGASNTPEKIGYIIFKNLIDHFRGKVFPVSIKDDIIQGVKAYHNLWEIPDDIDLAVIATPASTVPNVIEDCGKKPIEYALVIAGGFAELGKDGKKLSDELLEVAKANGVRLIGPNSLGLTCASSGLMASFSPEFGSEGRFSCIAQSGGIWRIVFDRAAKLGIGIEKYVGSGNEIDLTSSDYLEYLAEDQKTLAILMYVEGIREGRRFIEVASKTCMKKPIVAIKGGVTHAGSRVTPTHTASLAGPIEVYHGAFRQCGIVQVRDPVELVDYANLLSTPTIRIGVGAAILSAGGGLAILGTDAFESAGLRVPRFSEDMVQKVRERLRGVSILENPLDLGMTAVDERGFRNLEYFGALALGEDEIDWLVFANNADIFLPEELMSAAKSLQQRFPNKRVLTVWYSTNIPGIKEALRRTGKEGVLAFTSLSTAASAAREYYEYSRWKFSKQDSMKVA
jgi:acyl-CoA synthetase (NDP forming)